MYVKHERYQKNGNTYDIALSPEEDRTVATINMYINFHEVWTCDDAI